MPYYTYFDALSTDLNEGETYTISITCGEYETDNGIAAWIDFNAAASVIVTVKVPIFKLLMEEVVPPFDHK